MLKPAFEGSSKGIRSGQLADTAERAAALFEQLATGYEQPILVEQFIAGDEVTVGIIGNGPTAEVVGTMRIGPRQPCERFVYSLDVKRHWEELGRLRSARTAGRARAAQTRRVGPGRLSLSGLPRPCPDRFPDAGGRALFPRSQPPARPRPAHQ